MKTIEISSVFIRNGFNGECKFKHQFTRLNAEPTKSRKKSGKTIRLNKILTNHEEMISHPIERKVYYFSRWQNAL